MTTPKLKTQKPDRLLETFQNKFKLNSFRPQQREIIETVLTGQDVLVLMPTGGGKSLCYQLPALISKGLTIVISPLISLIEDQTYSLQKCQLPVDHYFGEMEPNSRQKVLTSLSNLKLLYTTPESIQTNQALIDAIRVLHQNQQLARFVIDEAHCVSIWGHDFRPDYLNLKQLRSDYPEVGMTALTATARLETQADIIKQLTFRPSHRIFKTSYLRPNLRFQVQTKTPDPIDQVARLIKTLNQKNGPKSGIVYCLSRKDCQETCQELQKQGIRADFYHAGILAAEKTRILNHWLTDQIQVVVSTTAFGLGINKTAVSFIINRDLPNSLEEYYQEAGRAGRDGQKATCYLLYCRSDVHRWQMINPESAQMTEAIQRYSESRWDCRMRMLVEYLGEPYLAECEQCDNCRRPESKCVPVTNFIEAIWQIVEQSPLIGRSRLVTELSKISRGWSRPCLERLIQLAWRHQVITYQVESSGYQSNLKPDGEYVLKFWSGDKPNLRVYPATATNSVNSSQPPKLIKFELLE